MESWEILSKHFWISSSIAKRGGPMPAPDLKRHYSYETK